MGAGSQKGSLPAVILETCKQRGWSLHWAHRGCYLHLEAAELIEAVRGKHGGDVAGEAADVLLVLMSITEASGVPWDDVMDRAWQTAMDIRSGKKGVPVSDVPEATDAR